MAEFHSFLCFNNMTLWWLPRSLSGRESACQCRRYRFSLWVGKILWRRKWQSTVIFLLGNAHGPRSLAGYSHGHDLVTTSYVYSISSFSICLLMGTSLCRFHIMATGSSAASNTRVRVSFQISFFIFSGYIPGVELLHHMVVLFSFEKHPYNFPQWLHYLYSHQQCMSVSFSPHPCQYYCRFFDGKHSDRCEVLSHYPFDLFTCLWLAMLSIFSCACWPSLCLFQKKMSIQVFCPILSWVVSMLNCMSCSYILEFTC